MIISAIVVTGLSNEIGKNNQLLCHLPADLKFFKATTMGCPIIMGRKTYESIGRLLPGRKNIIISRNTNYRVEGAEIHTSPEAAINYCKTLPDAPEKIFIIGGAEIYKIAMPLINEFYRTLIKNKFDADVFITALDESGFKMTWEECHNADEKNKFDYCFQRWKRI
jgi:dihydrofolate reductase